MRVKTNPVYLQRSMTPAYWMDTSETPATTATDIAAPQRVQGDQCVFTTPKTFLTQEEIILKHTVMCCLLLSKNKEYTQDPSDFFLKGSVRYR